MNINLLISGRMTRQGEDGYIRLSRSEQFRLNCKPGGQLQVNNGEVLLVEDLFFEDEYKGKQACVSWDTFARVLNLGPYKPTLGCDPEFIFLSQHNNVIPANFILPALGPIGSDGPLAELRPEPGENELEVVENLRRLIRSLPQIRAHRPSLKKVEGHSFWQNSGPPWKNYAIGFHIHLGIPKQLTTLAAPKSQEFFSSFITALDYFVGIPAMLLEDSNVRRLGDRGYGKPGDYRLSAQTIEYRTPGGYHLRHPVYAAGIMALALCAGGEILTWTAEESDNWRNLDKFCDFDRIRKRFSLPEKREIWWVLADPSKRSAIPLIPNMLQQLQSLESYKTHGNSIATYFRHVLENIQYSPNLLENW
jgi:hypothetical protein